LNGNVVKSIPQGVSTLNLYRLLLTQSNSNVHGERISDYVYGNQERLGRKGMYQRNRTGLCSRVLIEATRRKLNNEGFKFI
jgi:hypothetical protein